MDLLWLALIGLRKLDKKNETEINLNVKRSQLFCTKGKWELEKLREILITLVIQEAFKNVLMSIGSAKIILAHSRMRTILVQFLCHPYHDMIFLLKLLLKIQQQD